MPIFPASERRQGRKGSMPAVAGSLLALLFVALALFLMAPLGRWEWMYGRWDFYAGKGYRTGDPSGLFTWRSSGGLRIYQLRVGPMWWRGIDYTHDHSPPLSL